MIGYRFSCSMCGGIVYLKPVVFCITVTLLLGVSLKYLCESTLNRGCQLLTGFQGHTRYFSTIGPCKGQMLFLANGC